MQASQAALMNMLTEIKADFKSLDTKMDGKFTAMDTKMDGKFAAMDTKMDAKFTTMDSKIEAKFTAVDAKIKEEIRSQSLPLAIKIGGMAAVVATVAAYFGFQIGHPIIRPFANDFQLQHVQ